MGLTQRWSLLQVAFHTFCGNAELADIILFFTVISVILCHIVHIVSNCSLLKSVVQNLPNFLCLLRWSFSKIPKSWWWFGCFVPSLSRISSYLIYLISMIQILWMFCIDFENLWNCDMLILTVVGKAACVSHSLMKKCNP